MNDNLDFIGLARELNKGKQNPYKNATKNNIFDIHKKQIAKLKKDCLSLSFPHTLETLYKINQFRDSVKLLPKILLNITYNLSLFCQANNENKLGFSVEKLKAYHNNEVNLELLWLLESAQHNYEKRIQEQKKYLDIDSKLLNAETINQYGNLLPDKVYALFLSNLETKCEYRLLLDLGLLTFNTTKEKSVFPFTPLFSYVLSNNETEQLKNFLLKAAD